MSLATRCPACSTVFKVVQDQLRVSEGWVRCGQCAQVFDGTVHLHVAPADGGTQDSASSQAPAAGTSSGGSFFASVLAQGSESHTIVQAPRTDGLTELATEAASDCGHPTEQVGADVVAVPAEWLSPVAGDADAAGSYISHVQVDTSQERDFAQRGPYSDSVRAGLVMSQTVDHDGSSRSFEQVQDLVPSLDEASFLQAQQPPKQRSWWATSLALVLLGLATIALGAQVVLHERHQLYALYEPLRPGLKQFCSWAGCDITPVQQIESILVEGTSFNAVRGSNYRLNVGIRNNAPIAVATPSLELTLHDAQDDVLTRRVLSPLELGWAQSSLPATSETTANVVVSVAGLSAVPAKRMAGYRIVAFYP